MARDGVLVIDKPAGMTSAEVVARTKRALRARRVGHTGTLDPMATGVLPIVVGEGTKLAAFLLLDDKEYEGELELGVETDTLDAEGTVVGRRPWDGVGRADLERAMAALTGEIDQVPPMHAALKHGGRRLYELAREGVEVERAPRRVRVDRFTVVAFEPPRARFVVACSKGTYVRALVRDLGAAHSCGATLTALRRTRAGRFTLADALPLDTVLAAPDPDALPFVSLADALDHLPALPLDEAGARAARQGKPLFAPPDASHGQRFRLLDPRGDLVAVTEVRGGGRLAYLRVFA